ncbi:cell cycle regulator of non-homologous end joining isoform X1 [Calonectris borealis]|uniref:cell cycle regulator of non-homologous end joining isoform X1 n=1 Tax=Calonectris borealis TaxID=1323832 RepID=UPI003F4C2475
MAAGARRRLLPAWMGAVGDERAAAAPPRKAGRRQAAAGPRAAAAVVYCMDEAELVDVALAVLAEPGVVVFPLVRICSARNVRRRPGLGAKRSRSSSQRQRRLLAAQPARGRAASAVRLFYPLLTLVLVPTQRGQAGSTLRTMY